MLETLSHYLTISQASRGQILNGAGIPIDHAGEMTTTHTPSSAFRFPGANEKTETIMQLAGFLSFFQLT